MTNPFGLSGPYPFTELPAEEEVNCPCLKPDDQYLMEIEEGSLFLTHKACGKAPRGLDALEVAVDRLPVTVTAHLNCDGSAWHGENRCDCGITLVATINGVTVNCDGVPYLVGRDYRDHGGEVWHVTNQRDSADRPLVYLLPEGAGAVAPLPDVIHDFGPFTLIPTE